MATIPSGELGSIPSTEKDPYKIASLLRSVVERVTALLSFLAATLPASSTDNAVARFDGTTGALQNSGVTVSDANEVGAATFDASTAASAYQINNAVVLFVSGNYTQINSPTTLAATLGFGNTVDPSMYVAATNTIFRSTANVEYGRINATSYQVANATAIPAGGTAAVGLTLSSTANFGIFFGSGAPSLSAAQGSLYLRSDGSADGTSSNRIYVNSSSGSGTTWTPIRSGLT